MNSYSREILHSYSSENEYHGCSTSPSDLSPSPEAIKRSNSSPIQSDLPTLFSNLRTNEKTKNGSSSESTSRSLFKKFLSLGKSDERDDQPQLNQQLTHGIFNPFKSRSKSHDDTPSNNSSESLLSYRHVTIPPIFLKDGMPLLKVSNKSKKRILFKIDPDNFMVSWNKPTTHRLLTPTKSNSNSQAMAPVASISNSVADGFITGTSVNLENDSPLSTSKKYHREVSIDDIKNMLYQEDASNYREELHISKEHEHNWLTLFYFNTKKQKLKTFHVIADSEHDFKRLVTVLLDLKRLKGDFARNFLLDLDGTDEESIRRSMILEGGKQLKQFLSFYDILKYCKRLNINVSSSYLRKIFTEVAPEGSTLDFEQFKEFVSILKYRDDISNIYDANLDGEKRMTYSNFRIFLKKVQLDSFTDDQIMKLYNNFSGGGENGGDYITIDGFNNFLNSKYNNPIKFKVDDSYFEKPFNEYFISSSHNTYLMGRQIAGDSSIEGYIKALQKGCRCVEIDVWDGEMPGEVSTGITSDQVNENNQCVLNIVVELEPTVSHGRTFTTTISFLNVVKTIKKYAFIASPYPVIISLETHCNIDNQRKMVSTLKEILGEALVLDPIDDFFGLPSPKQLKYKILVKVKRTSESSKLSVSESGKYYSSNSTTTSASFSEDNTTGVKRGNSFSLRGRNRERVKPSKICEELSDLGVYFQGIKFRNFSLPESKTFNHIFSLSEKSLNSMLKDEEKRGQIDKHNRKYLMRMYPSRYRLTSTNFNPLAFWSHGIQMVATNWQTYDLGQQLNEAMFEGVKKTGYVIKPIDLRKPLLKSMRSIVSSEKKILFCIEVISAHQLPRPKDSALNPFVTFEILGATDVTWCFPASNSSVSQFKTKVIAENGFNPIWNEKFSGIITAQNDLVFIRFGINSEYDDEKHPIGIVVARLSDLKKGYRYLPVNDVCGEELIYSQLFIRIDYQELSEL